MPHAIDWNAVSAEVAGYLRDLIRIDTTNPPGSETPAARYVADVLARAGVDAQVLGPTPDRCSVVARLPGTGRKRPLLLLSHLDVVTAEPAYWTHPPFEAVLKDGVIWGRGATDCKGPAAQELMVLLLLKRAGLALDRDVILAATADEEAGGFQGIGWLLGQHPDLLDAEYCINEGGGEGFRLRDRTFYICQTGEKGMCPLRLTARGRPGHGSVPHDDNAIVHLAQAIDRLAHAELPLHPTDTATAFLDSLGEYRPLMEAQMGDLIRAIQCNAVAPTMLQAGVKVNVIPSVAEAQVDCRVVPGQTREDVLAEMRAIVGDLPVEVDTLFYSPGLESAYDDELYHLIEAMLPQHDPEGIVVPFLMTGGTDGRYLARHGISVYGFMPLKPEHGHTFFERVHAHDECMSVDNLLFGTRVLYDIVHRFCTTMS